MAKTPASIKIEVAKEDLDHARELGRQEGVEQGRLEMINWLERAYLKDEGRPDRGTPQGDAILELARAASLYLKGLKGKPPKTGIQRFRKNTGKSNG